MEIGLLPWKVPLVTVRDSPVPKLGMDMWEGEGSGMGYDRGSLVSPLPTPGYSLWGHDVVC